ncbi:MAG: hypothetical protein Alpg2KO_16420 [Alphaproteobacteria bacterium]
MTAPTGPLDKAATEARQFLEARWPDWHRALGDAVPPVASAGTCARSAMFLARVLRQSGQSATVVHGTRPDAAEGYFDGIRWHGHSWVSSGDYIIDITADQFGDAPVVICQSDDPRYRAGEDTALPRFKRKRQTDVDALWQDWTLQQARAAGLHEVLISDTCRILARHRPDPSHKTVLLSFTGIRFGLGGVHYGGAEFRGLGERFDNTLFLYDLTRSWGNHLDWDQIAQQLAPFVQGRHVDAIGNSMGGFLAILASRILTLQTVISMVPQYSVHPDLMPEETRWKRYTRKISDWPCPSLDGCFQPTTRYTIITADNPAEQRHWSRFPVLDNINLYALSHDRHGLGNSLKKQGALAPILTAALEGQLTETLIAHHWPTGVRKIN